jgi:hypothetical protein
MKTLEEWNNDAHARHKFSMDNSPKLNGIECPECGEELLDSSPMITLTSSPPKKNIHCECGYRGYRIA